MFRRLRAVQHKIGGLDDRLDAAVKARDDALDALGSSLLRRDDLSDLVAAFAQTAAELAADSEQMKADEAVLAAERVAVVADRDSILADLDTSLAAVETKRGKKRAELRVVEDEMAKAEKAKKAEKTEKTDASDVEPDTSATESRRQALAAALHDLARATETLRVRRRERALGFEARLDDLHTRAKALAANIEQVAKRRRATLIDLGREALNATLDGVDATLQRDAVEALETVRALRSERRELVNTRAHLDLGPLWRVAGVTALTILIVASVWAWIT